MRQLHIELIGEPAPQARPRFSRQKDRVHTYSPKANLQPYKRQIQKLKIEEPLSNALSVEFIFYLSRPASVPKTKRLYPSVKPDMDNLQKGVQDLLNKIAYHDDSQIVDITAKKRYTDDGSPARTVIHLKELN